MWVEQGKTLRHIATPTVWPGSSPPVFRAPAENTDSRRPLGLTLYPVSGQKEVRINEENHLFIGISSAVIRGMCC